jgi:hypothetical protein
MKHRYFDCRWPKVEATLKKEWLAAKQAVLRNLKPLNHNKSGV